MPVTGNKRGGGKSPIKRYAANSLSSTRRVPHFSEYVVLGVGHASKINKLRVIKKGQNSGSPRLHQFFFIELPGIIPSIDLSARLKSLAHHWKTGAEQAIVPVQLASIGL